MISVDRDRLLENVPIRPKGTWWTDAAQLTQDAIDDWPDHTISDDMYGHDNVRAALEELFFRKCAYCETRIARFDLNVEHYRPKGRVAEDSSHTGYYWLAYTWTNLYPSCQHCNQRRTDKATYAAPAGGSGGKQDQFPLEPGSPRAATPDDNITTERPLLLDPCSINPDLDPEQHLRYRPDGSIYGITQRGEKSCAVYHLDTNRMRDDRLEIMCLIDELRDEQVADGLDPDTALDNVLTVMTRPGKPAAGLARAVAADPAAFGF